MPIEADKRKEKRRIFCVITQGEEGGAQRFVSQLAHDLNPERFDLHVVWGLHRERIGQSTPLARVAWHCTSLIRNISPFRDVRAVYELRRQMQLSSNPMSSSASPAKRVLSALSPPTAFEEFRHFE